MKRTTGTYSTSSFGGEEVRAFVPHPLPPADPALVIEGQLKDKLDLAMSAIDRLEVAGGKVPSSDWFLYGFVRKEAVVSSQIEGTQATLEDVVSFEATQKSNSPADVEEVCNYVDALTFARKELSKPKGMPLCTRLLCELHKRLLKGVRGKEKQPGKIRKSQNWIGGTRPGKAHFVPPPPEAVNPALGVLEKWIHSDDALPPLIKAGLAHVQFETIHPFLDGNGRVGRLLITLLVEHWDLLSSPLLYLSLGFKRHQREYYRNLDRVRTEGDWEGWLSFFLDCVKELADDAVKTAQNLFALVEKDRRRVANHDAATVSAIRLYEKLLGHPMITLSGAIELLDSTKPTTGKAIEALTKVGVLKEITGKKRDRVYAYKDYLNLLVADTKLK